MDLDELRISVPTGCKQPGPNSKVFQGDLCLPIGIYWRKEEKAQICRVRNAGILDGELSQSPWGITRSCYKNGVNEVVGN